MVAPLPPIPPIPPPPAPPVVLRPYAPPERDWLSGHRGTDLSAAGPVRSLAPGTVAFVGSVGGMPVVTVALGDGRRVTYQPVTAQVRPGQRVARGDVIGTLATGPGHCGAGEGCVHVGLRDDVRYWDPAVLLQVGYPVLKPDG